MPIIYLDSLFAVNLLADYLLCLLSARLCALVLKRKRYLLAALFGAVYAVCVWLPGLRFLAGSAGKLGAGLGMAAIAYGGEKQPLRCAAVFFAVSAAFGGALWALGGTLRPGILIPGFLLCALALRLGFQGRGLSGEERRVRVKLRFLGRECEFMALRDSGNRLRDPLSGARVLLACPHALRPVFRELSPLLDEPPVELLRLCEQLPELRGRLRLLPFRALSGEGLLPVFRPEALELDGRSSGELLVAVSPRAAGGDFEGII